MTDMDDARLEQLLRQVRPSAPDPGLRARILSARRPAGRAWPWVTAAAALLAFTIALPTADGRGRHAVAIAPTPWEVERSLLADMLGGDREAERLADQIVALNESRAASASLPPATAIPELP
jgi:hypothetical protein